MPQLSVDQIHFITQNNCTCKLPGTLSNKITQFIPLPKIVKGAY